MPLPSRAEILGFIARHEPLEKTLEAFSGLTREHLRALLREAALLMRAEEEGVEASSPEAAAAPQPPIPETGPRRDTLVEAQAAPLAAEGGRKRLLLFSDGAARGNPGPAGAGAVLTREDGTVVAKCGKYLGVQTNNVAEYTAVIIGLETALRLGANEVEVVADSELMVRQLTGAYRVKNAGLKPLYAKAKELLGRFLAAQVRHIPREQNKLADEMSNRAIDEKM
ncbi:MAG: ribonuclease HI family protein [Deltaproteobacteria bacterium]|nr:ribonuclease HI family protein [Deltaproteobacteria bacterium]